MRIRLKAREPDHADTATSCQGNPDARTPSGADLASFGSQRCGIPIWRLCARFLRAMGDTSRRSIYLSAIAIPGHVVMAAWKAVLLAFSPSLFMLANVLYTLGLAIVKLLVVLADRRVQRYRATQAPRRAYRASGVVVLVLSATYVGCCTPFVFGTTSSMRYGQFMALAIATVTFGELGFSLHGVFAARRNKDVLMEAIKLSNLAASLILLVLTQTALLSLSADEDSSSYNGVCGMVLGFAAAVIGGHMLCRRFASGIPPRTTHLDRGTYEDRETAGRQALDRV